METQKDKKNPEKSPGIDENQVIGASRALTNSVYKGKPQIRISETRE